MNKNKVTVRDTRDWRIVDSRGHVIEVRSNKGGDHISIKGTENVSSDGAKKLAEVLKSAATHTDPKITKQTR